MQSCLSAIELPGYVSLMTLLDESYDIHFLHCFSMNIAVICQDDDAFMSCDKTTTVALQVSPVNA